MQGVDLNQEVEKMAKERAKALNFQTGQDQGDDPAAKDGSKLTKRKQGKGNLKRNVGNEMQREPALQKLSSKQMKNLGISDNQTEIERRKKLGGGLRTILETILEWISAADLYTDILIFVQLLNTVHYAWTTITIFSMLAPFFACQTPLIMFLKE